MGYVRVSRVGGRGGDLFLSPDLQPEEIARAAAREVLRVADVLEELDASGGDAARPLGALYGAFEVPVADVAGAFSLANSAIQPSGPPLNVERVCEWTWMCSMGDIHADNTGYGEIAAAFLAVLDD